MPRKLSNPEKVAILLFLLGEDGAANILNQLSPEEVAQVGDAMAVMGTIDKRICDQVLNEFSHLLDTRPAAQRAKPTQRSQKSTPVDDLLVKKGRDDGVRVQLSSRGSSLSKAID